MSSRLVSVITPCYNAGSFIHRLLDSILDQDYLYLEMYIVDDGSTDNTKSVVDEYVLKFVDKGYSLTYIYQENSGQSVAINKALKLVRGDYLVWPDSDDFYASSNAISKMVSILDKSEDSVSMVRCLPVYLNENLIFHHKMESNENLHNEYLFEDCILGKCYFLSGGYMVKMNVLDLCIKDREIYVEKNAGQNWQLMLPLLYQYRCITIEEYLYNVVIREISHSRGQYKSFEEENRKFQAYESTLVNTLQRISALPLIEKELYIRNVSIKYLWIYFDVSLKYCHREQAKMVLQKLKNKYKVKIPLLKRIDYIFCQFSEYYQWRKKVSLLLHKAVD